MSFKLDMMIYDFKNESEVICDDFKRLKDYNLFYLKDIEIAIFWDPEDEKHGEEVLKWYDPKGKQMDHLFYEKANAKLIEEFIKDCFDNNGIKYEYIKVELS